MKKTCMGAYTMEYYSGIKKNEIMPFAAVWMKLEIIILSEVSQTEKDKHMIYLESKKNDTNELIYKMGTDSQTEKTKFSMVTKEVGEEE